MSMDQAAIRGIHVPIGGMPREVSIAAEESVGQLKSLEDLLGGCGVDCLGDVPFAGVDLWVPDNMWGQRANRAIYASEEMAREGLASQMDFRTAVGVGTLYTILCGDIVAIGHDDATGEAISLTPSQMERMTEYFTEVSGPASGHDEAVRSLTGQSWGSASEAQGRGTDIGCLLESWRPSIGDRPEEKAAAAEPEPPAREEDPVRGGIEPLPDDDSDVGRQWELL